MSNVAEKRGVVVKKPLLFIILTVLMLSIALGVNAQQLYYNNEYHYYDAGEIVLKVNGKTITGLPMQPVIINDSTMVPVRELFEAIGSEVTWHDDTCQVEVKDNGISVKVKIGDRNAYVNNKLVKIEEPQPLPMLIGTDPTLLKSMVPVRFIAQHLDFKVDWNSEERTVLINTQSSENSDIVIGTTRPDKENNSDVAVMPEEEGSFGSVTVDKDAKYDYIYISTRYGVSPRVTRYENPERIVFDFPNAAFQGVGKTITLEGNCVDAVRYSNHENAARLVLDINEQTQALVMSSERGILIRAEKSKNDSLIYDAFQKRVYFDKSYVGSGKKVDNGYKVTFTNLKLDNQVIEINDTAVTNITITSASTGCTVTVEGNPKFSYTAEKGFYISDSPEKDEIQKPAINNNAIVIDAGHGGTDPGAVGYNSSGKAVAYESHINLAIALMVGEKLEASGLEVVYTRDSDKYIKLQERAEIANKLECRMFVSIHCNSIDKGNINGTQVYYHPASETGTILAENIYDKIVALTGLSPKKTQNGSHLYVIRSTASPAVLVETAFISNESDRNYLLSKKGQETLAEAIYQGIMESLENM